MTSTVYIPNTLQNWPWPRTEHQHYQQCKIESIAWLTSFSASFSPRLQKAIVKSDFSLLASMAFCNLSEEGCLRGCDLLGLFLIFEEFSDASDATQTSRMADIVMDALRNPSKLRPEGECIVGEIARQFWSKAVLIASPTSQRRFIAAFQEYVGAVVQESADRSQKHIRTIQSYFEVRRGTVGAKPAFAFSEIHMSIPDYVMENEIIQRLHSACIDMIIINNDMVSYNVEQARGDGFHNIITIVMNEFNISVQEAYKRVGAMFKTISDGFFEDRSMLPTWGPEIDKLVNCYIDSLGHWVRADNQWSFECTRYFGADGLRVFNERTVTLLPKHEHAPQVV